MLNARKTRPREALALMWSLGQLPNKDLSQGLKGRVFGWYCGVVLCRLIVECVTMMGHLMCLLFELILCYFLVWLQVMMPVLNVRKLSEYSVSYLGYVLK